MPISRDRAIEINQEKRQSEINNAFEALCEQIDIAILNNTSSISYSKDKGAFDYDHISAKRGIINYYPYLEHISFRDKLSKAYAEHNISLRFVFRGQDHWFWGNSEKVTIYIEDL